MLWTAPPPASRCAKCMSRPFVARCFFGVGELSCCSNVYDLYMELLLRAIMDIRTRPRLFSGTTSMGHFGTQSRGHDGQTVRPSPSSHLADLGGNSTPMRVFHCLILMILGGRESGSRSCLGISRLGRFPLVDRRCRGPIRPRQCARVCWRGRSPACCDAAASRLSRSNPKAPAELPLAVAPG